MSAHELLSAVVGELPAPAPVEPFAFSMTICCHARSPSWSRRRSRWHVCRRCGACAGPAT